MKAWRLTGSRKNGQWTLAARAGDGPVVVTTGRTFAEAARELEAIVGPIGSQV
jgi:hypothetical protein